MTADSSRVLRGTPDPGDAPRWHQLVDRLDVDELTETFLSLIHTVPGYDPPPVPISEVRRTGRLSFAALVEGLRSGGLPGSVSVASDVGISRARAGIPITSLMTAIRLDFTVLWEALTRVASTEDAELVVRHTGNVLRTVDEYAGQTQRAYVTEQQRMRDEASSVRQGLIAGVFQDPQPTDERLQAIADELGIPFAEPLVAVAAVGDDITALRVFVSEAERAGAAVFTHHLGDALVAFTRPLELPGSRIDDLGRQLASLRVGIATAETGLRELRQRATTARDLARLITPEEGGAMTWSRGWARLASRNLLSAGSPILADVLAALASCGDAERSRLEEAVRSYLVTGSIGETAATLYCHRNTITNRLHRFAALTGVDPLIPQQAARLVVGWA